MHYSIRSALCASCILLLAMGCTRGPADAEAARARAAFLEAAKIAAAQAEEDRIAAAKAAEEKRKVADAEKAAKFAQALLEKAAKAEADEQVRRIKEQANEKKKVDFFHRHQTELAKTARSSYDRDLAFLKSNPLFAKAPPSPYHRTLSDSPKSYQEEFQLVDRFLADVEAAATIKECEKLHQVHLQKIFAIRKARYKTDLEAHLADVLKRLGKADGAHHFVIAIEPVMTTFDKLLFIPEVFLAPDGSTARHIVRVEVIEGKMATAERIVAGLFARNLEFRANNIANYEKRSPWRLVASFPMQAEAVAAANKEAELMRAEMKDKDFRGVQVVVVPKAK